jgi:hypothetical protein
MAEEELSPELIKMIDDLGVTAQMYHLLDPALTYAKENNMTQDETYAFLKSTISTAMKNILVKRLTDDPEYPFNEPELFDKMLSLARLK